MFSKYYPKTLVLLFLFLLVILLIRHDSNRPGSIRRRGKLRVITDNNANCYYFYKGEPMGMEYELAKGFADYLNVELEIITPDWQNMYNLLKKNKADLIAANLTITDERRSFLEFSKGLMPIQQFIITHVDDLSVTKPEDLQGKTIHIRRNTSYHESLKAMIASGLDIKLELYDDLPSEEFIRRVSSREIELTVSDSHIAHLNRHYYPNIRFAFPIENEQYLGWAVRKGNMALVKKINTYFEMIHRNGTWEKLYEKYYGSTEMFDYVDLVKFHERLETRLPKYVSRIKLEAEKYGFDWRLIAAMIYQESHFNPRAKSFTGVRGLMQLTLITAKEMGVSNRLDPDQSIRGGIKYLNKIYQRFQDIDDHNRMHFTLAAYNIGYGHIRDAQFLAQQKGLDKTKWSSLEKTLPLLHYRKYHQLTNYGYARGNETVRYVNRIFSYYEILRRQALNVCEN